MTNPFDPAAVLDKIERGHQEVSALCKGRFKEGGRDWRMYIPVQRDDSDIVLSEALRAGREAVAEVERLTAELARLTDYYLQHETIRPDGELGIDAARLVRIADAAIAETEAEDAYEACGYAERGARKEAWGAAWKARRKAVKGEKL